MTVPNDLQEGLTLGQLVDDFAGSLVAADRLSPVAVSVRTKVPFQPGIGPHSESKTVELTLDQMASEHPDRYSGHALGVPYGLGSRQKCDLCLGPPAPWDWAIEVKMFRPMGDNGKPNDNILMHIISPYPNDRSALTDCTKLAESTIGLQKAGLIYGYSCAEVPMAPGIEAFEVLARHHGLIGERHQADFGGLVHPVHQEGSVFAWDVVVPSPIGAGA